MKRYEFTCTLLSDLVISSTTATEGFNRSLDYIPGSKFLGIVAGALYQAHSEDDCLDLFHSGNVRYGDAYPMIGHEAGLPVPFDWFRAKRAASTTDTELYLDHLLTQPERKQLTEKGIQLKQVRNGYFAPEEKQHLNITQGFAIRSAYDREELRAKDSMMYGYFSLPKGSVWRFVVEDDTESHGEKIAAALRGKKRIGRSRSAEYGLVEISEGTLLPESAPAEIPASELTMLYAQSNLCFYDDYGKPSVRPTASQLGLPDGSTILWDKSHIRSRLYQTWNGKRHNRNADRLIIGKGSVFAVSHAQAIPAEAYSVGIGAHRAEGFGKILANPAFLLSDSSRLDFELASLPKALSQHSLQSTVPQAPSDSVLLAYLKARQQQDQNVFSMDQAINTFLDHHGAAFRGISSSQWGTIRASAKHTDKWNDLSTLLFHTEIGALYRGQSEKVWRTKDRRRKLEEFLTTIPEQDRVLCTLKLSAEIAKRTRIKNEPTTQSA